MKPVSLLLFSFFAVPAFAQVNASKPPTPKSGNEVKRLIGEVYERNSIASLNVPYHFLATFQTFTADGQPDGGGSVERWAESADRMKTTTRFRDHSVTEYRTDKAYGTNSDATLYTNDGFSGSIMSYFVDIALFYAAFPPAAILQRNVETSALSLQGDMLDCGMFVFERGPAAYPQPPRDNFCVSRDTGNLVLRQTAGLSIRFRDFAPFLDRSIARTISASKGAQVRFRIKVEQLDQARLDDAGMTPPADASLTSPLPDIWATKPEETSPTQTSPLTAPPQLKATHASGAVVLYVLISQTGAVTDVEPIFVASPDLAEYATQLARGYTYKPILRHDKPLEEIAHAWFSFKF